VTDPMVVLSGLDLDARRRFIEIASSMSDSDQQHIELDCSQVGALDEKTLGMLVTVARKAQRRGQRVVLDPASERIRHDLDDAGVSYLFAWSA
jgi:ABC-type transporter Mla MlaB component